MKLTPKERADGQILLALFTQQDRQDLLAAAVRAAAKGSRQLELTAGLRERMNEAAMLYGVGMSAEPWP